MLMSFTAGALIFGVSGCSGGDSEAKGAEKDTAIEAAFDACSDGKILNALFDEPLWKIQDQFPTYFQVGDEGRTLVASGVPDRWIPVVVCFFDELETSDATIASIQSTTAMSGTQQASDGDLSYEWTYHPDNGLNLIVTDDS